MKQAACSKLQAICLVEAINKIEVFGNAQENGSG